MPQSDYIPQKEATQQIFDCWLVPFCRIQDPILSRFKINRTSPLLDFVLLYGYSHHSPIRLFLLATPSTSCLLLAFSIRDHCFIPNTENVRKHVFSTSSLDVSFKVKPNITRHQCRDARFSQTLFINICRITEIQLSQRQTNLQSGYYITSARCIRNGISQLLSCRRASHAERHISIFAVPRRDFLRNLLAVHVAWIKLQRNSLTTSPK